jgi:hypothetical protein
MRSSSERHHAAAARVVMTSSGLVRQTDEKEIDKEFR